MTENTAADRAFRLLLAQNGNHVQIAEEFDEGDRLSTRMASFPVRVLGKHLPPELIPGKWGLFEIRDERVALLFDSPTTYGGRDLDDKGHPLD